MRSIAASGSVDRELIELSLSDIVGKPWTCPALDQLFIADAPED